MLKTSRYYPQCDLDVKPIISMKSKQTIRLWKVKWRLSVLYTERLKYSGKYFYTKKYV